MSMYAFPMATLTITKSPKSIEAIADQLKALGDQTRLEIVMKVAASENQEIIELIIDMFSTNYFRIYPSTDLVTFYRQINFK